MVKRDSENVSSYLPEVTHYHGQFVIIFSEYFLNVFSSEHSPVDAYVKDIKVKIFPEKIFLKFLQNIQPQRTLFTNLKNSL